MTALLLWLGFNLALVPILALGRYARRCANLAAAFQRRTDRLPDEMTPWDDPRPAQVMSTQLHIRDYAEGAQPDHA